ncbi:twin-arginine translocase TatA/TatE family subunit [Desulfobacter vibrioformis]|uniref:twin-arginine translocase TatA/TatE family subunit n=1 Tax=Desulfobacter vibrioformis TaxID=34031 RepID=UPI00055218C7|nr:twin-arginine translocase TatA/TatE family subunit [Desulfobacter vibrioformis]
MFGLGMPEILLILAIALIVIGPQKLPEVAKTLGKAMGEFKRSAQNLKNSIDIETTVQEVKPEPVKNKLKDVIKDITEDGPESKPQQMSTESESPGVPETKKNSESPQDSPDADAQAAPETDTAPPKA